jgi:hypothetical protein
MDQQFYLSCRHQSRRPQAMLQMAKLFCINCAQCTHKLYGASYATMGILWLKVNDCTNVHMIRAKAQYTISDLVKVDCSG